MEDIAHALSNQCRFGGHVREFYSVAQHSVLVSYVCDTEDALWGLLHDATEAYLVDVPTPVKRFLSDYKTYEKRLSDVIADRFGLPHDMPSSVHVADARMLATEARDLLRPMQVPWKDLQPPLYFRVEPLPPKQAEQMFWDRYLELVSDR